MTYRTYMGVRVSEREAELLQLGLHIDGHPDWCRSMALYVKIEAVRAAVERFLDYQLGDPLVDERPLPMIVQTATSRT